MPLAGQDFRHLLVLLLLALPVIGQVTGASGKLSLLFLLVIAVVDAFIGTRPALSRPHPWPAARHAWFTVFLHAYAAFHVALIIWGVGLMADQAGYGPGPAGPGAGLNVYDGAVWLGIAVGFVTGSFGITIAHELGHRPSRVDRALAQGLLMTVCYGHFYVEHNRGHHARVATPADPATARLGESFYRFLPRTVFGGIAHAWRLEALRLRAQGRWVLSPANRNLVYLAAQAGLCALAFAAAGMPGLLFFLVQAGVAVLLLELVNYVEHYGLVRQRAADGRYETVKPHHSWNADTWFGNALLINLQRHSDHHADSSRPYEALRSIATAPQLPTGYAGMILLALLPPLWFRVMDRRVAAARAAAASA
ncbi:MAG: alkane 1-monooxygenase [Burkholderiales bacterium]|nr:alkane 1-monooxygenase [Burkholderiales bacterium]